jgi:hypothetical protein
LRKTPVVNRPSGKTSARTPFVAARSTVEI